MIIDSQRFFQMEMGGLCADIRSMSIMDADECLAALRTLNPSTTPPEHIVRSDPLYPIRPSGCFIEHDRHNPPEPYFNYNPKGRRYEYSSPVCQKGKKDLFIS